MRLHIWKCQLLGGIIALAMTLGLAGGSLRAEDAARVRLLDDTLDLYVRDGSSITERSRAIARV